MNPVTTISLTVNEIESLIDIIRIKYGYDFSEYSQASFKRRVSRLMQLDNINSLVILKEKILNDSVFFNRFVEEVTVNVTEMFRDPSFYKVLVQDILPELSSLPLIRIWHAGCSTGEEVYSMAIILKEAGLLNKALLYATDINQSVLDRAKKGRFSVNNLNEYSENYRLSGGQYSLAVHYTENDGMIAFDEELCKRMVFSHHNLTIDQSFNEFHLILCRNVLIYFNRNLQAKVFKLFADSLATNGYLALGTKETLEFSQVANQFICTDKKNKIWKTKKS